MNDGMVDVLIHFSPFLGNSTVQTHGPPMSTSERAQ